jgi:hypothetical protein
MTKEIYFDIHFANGGIVALSARGSKFLSDPLTLRASTPTIYQLATGQGLHVRFENATVRDLVTGA